MTQTMTIKGHTFTTWANEFNETFIMSPDENEIVSIDEPNLCKYYNGSKQRFYGTYIRRWLGRQGA